MLTRLIVATLLAVVIAAGMTQITLTPIDPKTAVSPEHQVRQDMAIEAILAQHNAIELRVTRIEHVLDGLLAALVGILITQVLMHRQNRQDIRRGRRD